MMMLSQVACVLLFMAGFALSLGTKKSLDAPNYLQVILASYKVPKRGPQTESQTHKIDASDAGQSMSPQLESLLQLRRDIYHAYNLTYQIKDPIGRILYRNEYGDGSGSLKGSINFTKDNGKKAVLSYSLQVEEQPPSSTEPTPEQMQEPSMRNSVDGNPMTEKSYTRKEQPQIISISRAPQKLKSITMDNKDKVVQQEKYFYPYSGMRVDRGFDDLETLSSQTVEDTEQAPAFDDDMKGSVTVFHIKPKARGYEQVWKKGQGLVVNREYDLPNYDYRSAAVQRVDFEDGEDQKPVYVYQTRPAVRVFEVSRDTDGSYQIPDKYSSNIKQQGLEDDENYQILENYNSNIKQQALEHEENKQVPEKYSGNIKQQGMEDDDGEEPLYMTHSKPAVHVMQLNSDGGDSAVFGGGTQEQYPTDYYEIESQDGGYRSVKI